MKQVALITGGSRGIGFGIARQLGREGFDIAINGMRPEEDVAGALEELQRLGVDVIYCRGDVSLAADRTKMIAEVRAHFNRLNILVNNAGVAPKERKDVLETTEESFDRVVSTNLKSNYFLTQEAANWMIAQKQADPGYSACIINISSVSATMVSVNRGEYCISKAGISMATQLFAVRLGEFDIPVYEVRPGVIATDMTAGVKEKYDRLVEQGLFVQKRWGQPEDIGRVVGALAKGDFAYSTGQVFVVDGGITIPRL